MGIACEQRLTKLDQEIKALKAAYSIYGGLMKTYMSSGKWSLAEATLNFAVKFTPNFQTGENVIISSIYLKVLNNGTEEVWDDNFISIQDSSDGVTMNLGIVFADYEVQVSVATTVPGTFTRIS